MIQTNKLLPILTGIKQDKKLINESEPKLKLPNKKQARMESSFRLNPLVNANSQGFRLGLNPTMDFGNFSVGPYGVAAGSYVDPKLVNYGIRGSYDINPNMSISGDVNSDAFRLGLNYKFAFGGPNDPPNYRQMAIAQGIAAADYDKNRGIIDPLLAEVLQPGKYDPGFMARAKIAIARSKYPNIDNIISNIDRGTYQKAEGGMTNIEQPIVSEFGQHLFPGRITGIKGGDINQSGDYVTPLTGEGMLYDLITVDPYGASKLSKGEKSDKPGNFQLEIPMKKQFGGGQEDQVAQLIQAYAQMTGMDPQELIQKLQSLPQDQQQQALQSIAQEVQTAMAQQQQQPSPDQMGMAKEGGEPCFGCFDHYNPSPQAQDLEWYYKKAKGGTAYMMDDLYEPGGPTGNQTAVRDNVNTNSPSPRSYSLPHTGSNIYYGFANQSSPYTVPTNYVGSPSIVQNETSQTPYTMVTYPGDTLTDNQIAHLAHTNPTINANNQLEYSMDPYHGWTGAVRYKMSDKDLKKLQDARNEMSISDKLLSYMSYHHNNLPFAQYKNNTYTRKGTKKTGGQAYNEAFPQAQTYLPYNRPGETRPNFMFEKGGQVKGSSSEEYQKKLLIDLLNNR